MVPSSVTSPAMERAFEVLRQAPTRAPLTLTPDPEVDHGLAGWHRATRLTEAPFVRQVTTAYSAGLGSRHLAVGGACGLQHYAGRFVLAALGVWVQTGALPDLAHEAWLVRLDEEGHSLSVAPPVTGATTVTDVDGVAAAVLTDHLGPIVAALRATTRITERLAHGCIAASCATAFAALHRRSSPPHQAELAEIAARFMAAPAWPAGRPLLDLREIEVPTGPALVHERHVCCLIRLGRARSTCGTCPDIDPDERRQRTTHQATAALRGGDLTLGVPRVA